MDIMQLASKLLSDQLGGQVSSENASSALSGLLGDGEGGLDLSGIVEKMIGSGSLASIAQSWLGDGVNEGIKPAQILEMFGGSKLTQFGQRLGVNQEDATSGLARILPVLIDKSSSGGSLLDSVGGIGGAVNLAKGFFK